MVKAGPLALEAARSADLEFRDTATRAIGKFAESIPSGSLPSDLRVGLLDVLQTNLSDYSPGVHAKAVRSLGKLAKHGHLTARERWELAVRLRRILGQDENFEWDRPTWCRRGAGGVGVSSVDFVGIG